MNSKFLKLAEKVTAEIIVDLKNGNVSWKALWGSAGAACNYSTKRKYEGFNQFYLTWKTKDKGYKTPYFVTYKQAIDLGGHVRKGEKSTEVVFWKVSLFKKDNEPVDGEENTGKKMFYPFFFNVFNIDQVEGVEWILPEAITNDNTPIERAAAIMDNMPNRAELKHGGNQAYYTPTFDYVQIPYLSYFNSSEEYYVTMFHEYIHSTGHKSRLDRPQQNKFADEMYSKEELIAEIGAAYLSAHAGIEDKTQKGSVAYIQSWLNALRNDKTLLIYAANKAVKAAVYILGENDSQEAESATESAPIGYKKAFKTV